MSEVPLYPCTTIRIVATASERRGVIVKAYWDFYLKANRV